MTDQAAGRESLLPAPGSAVPGAPPPLKRALTPADGSLLVAPAPASAAKNAPVADPSAGAVGSVRGFTTATAMLGIAAGLELSHLLTLRRRGSRRR